MRVVILTNGTRGDIQPYIALGLGLKRAGHQVRLATHLGFKSFVTGSGLDFAPIAVDFKELMESGEVQTALAGGHTLRVMLGMNRKIQKLLPRIYLDAWEASQDAEALLQFAYPMWEAGYHIAQRLGIPCFQVALTPVQATRSFPDPLLGALPNLGGAVNRLTYAFLEQATWHLSRRAVNEWRQTTLHLPRLPLSRPKEFARLPYLNAFSSAVVPRPVDWPAHHHLTGYWFLDTEPGWHPPPELVDFLEAGPPPVYVGFGSMANRQAESITRLVVQAAALSQQRVVLASGWGGLRHVGPTQNVFVLDSVPHDWLFPRMAAVIHHGGSGTTGAAFRAGVPAMVVPHYLDQFFWGQRVAELGVGPQPIPRRQLTVERLHQALTAVIDDQDLRRRAAELGRQIRAEDGVACAVEVFQRELSSAPVGL